jgi:hypothetical protein
MYFTDDVKTETVLDLLLDVQSHINYYVKVQITVYVKVKLWKPDFK